MRKMFFSFHVKPEEQLSDNQIYDIFNDMHQECLNNENNLVPILAGVKIDPFSCDNPDITDNTEKQHLTFGFYEFPLERKIEIRNTTIEIFNTPNIICVYINVETGKLEFEKVLYFNENIFYPSKTDVDRLFVNKDNGVETIFLITSKPHTIQNTYDLLSKKVKLTPIKNQNLNLVKYQTIN